MFKRPEVYSKIELKPTKPKFEELRRYLVEEK